MLSLNGRAIAGGFRKRLEDGSLCSAIAFHVELRPRPMQKSTDRAGKPADSFGNAWSILQLNSFATEQSQNSGLQGECRVDEDAREHGIWV